MAAVVAAAVAVRRRYPVAALVALNAACLLWFSGGYPGRLIVLAPLVGCYTLAVQRGWRWGLAGALPTALIAIVAIRVVLADTETVAVVPIAVLLAATAASAGAAVGYYRAVLAVTQAQLAQEIQSREERARRLAAEERLRIARELHDVFGHTMATISVQAGVGLHVLEQRPGQAREALTAIKKICDDGLTDVKTILGILRADAPSAEGEPRAPRGGLDRLTDLLDTAEAGGLRVEMRVEGDPRPLPAPVDLAAYRIIQEALTNVLRHAEARTVRLTLQHAPSRLLVRVRDDGRTRCADHSGGTASTGCANAPARSPAGSPRLRSPKGVSRSARSCRSGSRDDVPVSPARPMTEPIRVLIADDEALVRGGFRVLIETEPGMVVVGEAADGATAVDLTRETHPDVVLMDIRMPGVDGLRATREIAADPDLAGVHVLILTTFDHDEYVIEAVGAGAAGFLIKNTEPAQLLRGIRVVAGGEELLSPGLIRRLVDRLNDAAATPQLNPQALNQLTAREKEIVGLVAEGLSNSDIAAALTISHATVKTHVSRAMTKLEARDRAQLVALAYRHHLVEPPGRADRV